MGCSKEAALPSEPGAGQEGRAKAVEVGGQHRRYTAEGPHSFAEIIPLTTKRTHERGALTQCPLTRIASAPLRGPCCPGNSPLWGLPLFLSAGCSLLGKWALAGFIGRFVFITYQLSDLQQLLNLAGLSFY